MTTGKGEDVDLLVTIISDPRIGWGTVALCGRAITATGRLNLWVLQAGKEEHDAEALSHILLTFGDASEQMTAVWSSFLESANEDALQTRLSSLVSKMETTIP